MNFKFQKGYFYVSQEGRENYEKRIVELAAKINNTLSREADCEKTDFGTVARPTDARNAYNDLLDMKTKLASTITIPEESNEKGVRLGSIVTIKNLTKGFLDTCEIVGEMEVDVDIYADVCKITLNSPLAQAIYTYEEGVTVPLTIDNDTDFIEIVEITKQKQLKK